MVSSSCAKIVVITLILGTAGPTCAETLELCRTNDHHVVNAPQNRSVVSEEPVSIGRPKDMASCPLNPANTRGKEIASCEQALIDSA